MVGTNLKNFQLLLVPFIEHHTAANIHALVCTIMNSMRPTWRDSLLAVSNDVKNTMTSRNGGLCALLESDATNKVLRFWCGSHQMDLVVNKARNKANDEEFDSTTNEFSLHLQKQHNLITAMRNTCAKDTTRWLARENMLKWMLDNCRRLLEHILKRPENAPFSSWWLTASEIQHLLHKVFLTFKSLERKKVRFLSKSRKFPPLLTA